MTAAEKREKAAKAKELLLSALKPGDTVYCICTHWTNGGNRSIVVLLQRPGYEGIWNFSAYAAHLTGWKFDQIHDGVVCNNSSELVNAMARHLFGDALQLSRRDL